MQQTFSIKSKYICELCHRSLVHGWGLLCFLDRRIDSVSERLKITRHLVAHQ